MSNALGVRGAVPAPHESTFDAIVNAARALSRTLYTKTAWPANAISVEVSPDVFDRVALIHAERSGEVFRAVIERGVINLRIDDELDLRISVTPPATPAPPGATCTDPKCGGECGLRRPAPPKRERAVRRARKGARR